jgi:hypothetical protein
LVFLTKGFFFSLALQIRVNSNIYNKILIIVKNLILIGFIVVLFGCNNNTIDGYTTVKVKEVEQVAGYTYLLVKAKGPEYWIAVSTMEAKPGETYHYKDGLLMEDFYSEELERTFEEVMFLNKLLSEKNAFDQKLKATTPGSTVTIEKSNVKIETVEGTITIGDLFSDPDAYEGKKIRIRGEVTKFNAAIIERNWVHIQDGTEYEGKFDLTATSSESFVVGSTVTVEGKVTLNLDFGYGYSYDILLEEAAVVN